MSPESEKSKAGYVWTRRRIAAVAGFVALALAIGIAAVRIGLAEPDIRMVGGTADVTIWYCRPGSPDPIPPMFYRFDFRLTNTGDAGGYATLDFAVNGTRVGSTIYLIPAHQVVIANATYGVDNCDRYASAYAVIRNVWKA